MSDQNVVTFNLSAEINRLLGAADATQSPPVAVVVSGGIATGKTMLRRQQYAQGYIHIDAAEIFLRLSQGHFLPFPGPFLQPMNLVGQVVSLRAVQGRRNIVTEIVGSDLQRVNVLTEALKSVGYSVKMALTTCDIDESLRRNAMRGDDISAYYTESFHYAWIVDACRESALSQVG
jgi:hypothetical protein